MEHQSRHIRIASHMTTTTMESTEVMEVEMEHRISVIQDGTIVEMRMVVIQDDTMAEDREFVSIGHAFVSFLLMVCEQQQQFAIEDEEQDEMVQRFSVRQRLRYDFSEDVELHFVNRARNQTSIKSRYPSDNDRWLSIVRKRN